MKKVILIFVAIFALAYGQTEELITDDTTYTKPSISLEDQYISAKHLKEFDIYFEKFRKSILKKELKEIRKYVSFPVKRLDCFEDECKKVDILEKEIAKNIYIKPPYTYKMDFFFEKGRIVCWYGYEVTRFTLYFERKNKVAVN